MQIVIDIPNSTFTDLKRKQNRTEVDVAVLKGTPLPKGHGDLIDRSDLTPDSDYEDGTFYSVSIGAINGAPTIVEADKAESEVK